MESSVLHKVVVIHAYALHVPTILARAQFNLHRRPLRDKVVLVPTLVRPHRPLTLPACRLPVLEPQLPPPKVEAAHQRAHDGAHLLQRKRASDAVHGAMREWNECVLGVCEAFRGRGHLGCGRGGRQAQTMPQLASKATTPVFGHSTATSPGTFPEASR